MLPQGLLYIRMSRSSLGKAWNTSRSCTGSGIRGKRSSIRWKGTVLATSLEAMSRRVAGEALSLSLLSLLLPPCSLCEQCRLLPRPTPSPDPDIFTAIGRSSINTWRRQVPKTSPADSLHQPDHLFAAWQFFGRSPSKG